MQKGAGKRLAHPGLLPGASHKTCIIRRTLFNKVSVGPLAAAGAGVGERGLGGGGARHCAGRAGVSLRGRVRASPGRSGGGVVVESLPLRSPRSPRSAPL